MNHPVKTDEAVVISHRDEWLSGFRDFMVVMLPVLAFGTMFGAASSAAGHSIWVSLWASVSIFAGASQFVFLEVYSLGVPAWSVVLAVFAVNFRHILYSAAAARKIKSYPPLARIFAFFLLTDLQFAAIENRASILGGKLPVSPYYYFGFGIPSYALWIVATGLGALSGALIKDPAVIGLDFVLPVYFLSILMGFRKRDLFAPVVLASGLVSVLVERTVGAPWHISLGALAGVGIAVFLTMHKNRNGSDHRGGEKVIPKEASND